MGRSTKEEGPLMATNARGAEEKLTAALERLMLRRHQDETAQGR